MRFVKKLFGGHKAPAARGRKTTTVRLGVEGLEERSLMAAGLGLSSTTALVNRPALAAALQSSMPAAPINFTPDTVFKLGNYWIDVPASYDAKNQTPAELFVWSHGSGGFSQYDIGGVAATAGGPSYITIALDGAEGGSWNDDMSTYSANVIAAIADVKTHFNIDPQRVILGGYSAGGDLSYRVAFSNSTQIAGVLVENTSPFRDTGLSQGQALAAPFHFHIIQLAHTGDAVYPLAGVRTETNAVKAAGLPGDGWAALSLIEQPGDHWDADNAAGTFGTNHDLRTYLLPHLGDGWTSAPSAQGPVQTLTRIVVSPGSASLSLNGSQQFTAQALDQFGNPLAKQPAFTWSVTGGGTISSSGLYKAPATAGSATVKATTGTVSGTTTVAVGKAAAPSTTVTFANTQDWGSGFTGYITMTNKGTTAINGWTLEFDFTGKIGTVMNNDFWDAQLVSHVGNHYVFRNADWDATIAAGQSIKFGFNASWANPKTAPTNFVLNGGTLGGTNKAPTVATAARASASPVTGKTTTLSVLGADDASEASLTYTWATTGTPPAAVTFSSNGSNAAKNTTATFSKAGTYNFMVTITDANGLSATSSVTVTVNQTLSGIVVSPAQPTVAVGLTRQSTASAVDQFGNTLATQPALTWSVVSGGGSITNSGLYNATASPGNVIVKATAGSVSGTATITIVPNLSAVASFQDTDDWGSGFTGYITMTNTGLTAINGWTVEFDFTGKIGTVMNNDFWNAQLVSHVGNHYVFRNADWDATIAAGKSVSFGFNADWANPKASPTNFVLNGVAIRNA